MTAEVESEVLRPVNWEYLKPDESPDARTKELEDAGSSRGAKAFDPFTWDH